MYRVRLTEEERSELKRRTRAPELAPATRDRIEMVRLSDAGMKVSEISRVIQISEQRVRVWLEAFLEGGFDALPDQPRPGRPGQLTPEVIEQLRERCDRGDRTWSLPQLAEWLEREHGVRLSANHLGTMLRRSRMSCRRTAEDLGHRQDPAAVAAAQEELAALEKGGASVAWTSAISTRPASP